MEEDGAQQRELEQLQQGAAAKQRDFEVRKKARLTAGGAGGADQGAFRCFRAFSGNDFVFLVFYPWLVQGVFARGAWGLHMVFFAFLGRIGCWVPLKWGCRLRAGGNLWVVGCQGVLWSVAGGWSVAVMVVSASHPHGAAGKPGMVAGDRLSVVAGTSISMFVVRHGSGPCGHTSQIALAFSCFL